MGEPLAPATPRTPCTSHRTSTSSTSAHPDTAAEEVCATRIQLQNTSAARPKAISVRLSRLTRSRPAPREFTQDDEVLKIRQGDAGLRGRMCTAPTITTTVESVRMLAPSPSLLLEVSGLAIRTRRMGRLVKGGRTMHRRAGAAKERSQPCSGFPLGRSGRQTWS
ncbi:hypothetical protein BJY59DRAFT_700730 [Rhodotorula toruloides]